MNNSKCKYLCLLGKSSTLIHFMHVIYKKSAVCLHFFPDAPEVEILNTLDDPILIFSEENLKQLQRRTEELKTERAMQKNKFK